MVHAYLLGARRAQFPTSHDLYHTAFLAILARGLLGRVLSAHGTLEHAGLPARRVPQAVMLAQQ